MVRAANRCPVRSSVSTIFKSAIEQRIHSSSMFSNFFWLLLRAPVVTKDGAVVALCGFV
jgi:hypothetical protein